jgi:quinol monooxygenase YgiN
MHIVARITARPDRVDAVREALLALVPPTRAEPGCLEYRLLQSEEAPTDFTFVERWRDRAAFEAHLATPHFRAAAARLADVVAAPPDIRRCRELA